MPRLPQAVEALAQPLELERGTPLESAVDAPLESEGPLETAEAPLVEDALGRARLVALLQSPEAVPPALLEVLQTAPSRKAELRLERPLVSQAFRQAVWREHHQVTPQV